VRHGYKAGFETASRSVCGRKLLFNIPNDCNMHFIQLLLFLFHLLRRSESALRQGFAAQNACTRLTARRPGGAGVEQKQRKWNYSSISPTMAM
jgi:hypothetical protein